VLGFLKLAGTRARPRVCEYPRIAVTGVVSCCDGLRARVRVRILTCEYGFTKLLPARILPVAILYSVVSMNSGGGAGGERRVASVCR
jgi:hypothetical protein